MRPFNHFASSAAVVLATLVGCNLHSGSGIDPNEIVEGGASDNEGDGGGLNNGSSGGGSGGNSEHADGAVNSSGSSGGSMSGSSSGANEGIDAGAPAPQDSGSTVNPGECAADPSTCVDCCGQFDPAGYQSFLDAVGPCLCGDGNGDVCSAACASELCIGSPYASMDDGCEKCVNSSGGRGTTCFMLARQQCTMNNSCTSFMGCYSLCPAGSQ